MNIDQGQGPVEQSLQERFEAYVEDSEEQPEHEEAEDVEEVEEVSESDDDEVEVEESEEEAEESEEEETEEEPETFEIKHNGQVRKVSRDELVELAQKGFDYTVKTGEVAEQRKALEHAQQQFQQAVEAQQAHMHQYAEMLSIDKQIEAYSKIDWDQAIESDPIEAQKAWNRFQLLREQRNTMAHEIQHFQQRQALEQQQQFAKLIEEGQRQLASEIKGWGPEVKTALIDFGRSMGFADQELSSLVDPRQVRILHKAYLYDQLQGKKKQAEKRVENLPKVVKPGAKPQRGKPEAEAAKKKFQKTRSVKDAAKYFEQFIE